MLVKGGPGGTVVIIPITWNVFKVTTVLTLWSNVSVTCWIWISVLTFGILATLTANVLPSNQWISLLELCNSCSWSESIRNLELKWRCTCTPNPNWNMCSNTRGLSGCIIDWPVNVIFQHTREGSKVKTEVFHLLKRVDGNWNRHLQTSYLCMTSYK